MIGIEFFFLLLITASYANKLFPLSIVHVNDLHARFEETNLNAHTCVESNECIGGYARVVHMVKELKKTRPNVIYLNAADNFYRTLWYNLFRWNVTQHFLNFLPADAMTLGNHEFDHKVEGLVPFLDAIKSPIVVCNIDDSLEPSFQGKFTKSTILIRNGRKIGVVGVMTTNKVKAGHWGRLNILPEVESVKNEVSKLTQKGIKIIIVLSHCGLDTDREIAKHGGPIDLIVGGHSHSFLFTGKNSTGPDTPVSDYPTIIEQESSRKVLIVQASAYAKYLGNITLFFDDEGEVKGYEGAPIFLSHDIPQDDEILMEIKPRKKVVEEFKVKKNGEINFSLDFDCLAKECSMGNLITDAMVFSVTEFGYRDWTGPSIGFMNPDGIRAAFKKGDITYADVVTVVPYENIYTLIELNGTSIREILEFGVSNLEKPYLMQVAGLRVTFDLNRKSYDRIVNLQVICQDCDVPHYGPIDDKKLYNVVMPDYVTLGGDGFNIPKYTKKIIFGPKDADAVADYLMKTSPIAKKPAEGRINFL